LQVSCILTDVGDAAADPYGRLWASKTPVRTMSRIAVRRMHVRRSRLIVLSFLDGGAGW
jgi:hypothetical protein